MFQCALRNYYNSEADYLTLTLTSEDERLSVGSTGDDLRGRTSATSVGSATSMDGNGSNGSTSGTSLSYYTDRLLEIFLLLVLDDTTGCDGTTIVLNVHALECVKMMIWSKCTPILQLALDLIKALLSCNPIYALVLEKSHVFLAVYGVLAVMVFRIDGARAGSASECDDSVDWIDLNGSQPARGFSESHSNPHPQSQSHSNPTDNFTRMSELFTQQSCKKSNNHMKSGTVSGSGSVSVSVGLSSKLSCLQDALYIAQHSSVSLAEMSLGCTGLNYLVALVYSVASCKMVVSHSSLSVNQGQGQGQGSRSVRNSDSGSDAFTFKFDSASTNPKPIDGLSVWSMPSYCMNCECECATVHCLHAR